MGLQNVGIVGVAGSAGFVPQARTQRYRDRTPKACDRLQRHGFFSLSRKLNDMDDKNKLPERPSTNPGLKDEKVSKDLLNEDPKEEKKAIERTSEDRLDEAE